MADELRRLLEDCDAAMLPFAAKEYRIPESLPNDTLAIIRGLTVEDVRRIHRVRQDVLIALRKAVLA